MSEDPNNKLEEILRKRFSNVEVQGSKDTWKNISDELDKQNNKNRFPSYRTWLVAACIVGLCLVSTLFLHNRKYNGVPVANKTAKDSEVQKDVLVKKESEDLLTDVETNLPVNKVPTKVKSNVKGDQNEVVKLEELITIKSDGEQRRFVLPDSSVVVLNRQSKLSYNVDFNAKERIVQLEGEGFFEITKNAAKPFIVEGCRSITKVLGTSFNLRTYNHEQVDEIEVLTGRVEYSLKDFSQSVILLPGQTGKVHLQQNLPSLTKSETSDLNFMAWKTKKLTFQKSDFQQVFSAMERYFNVKIKLKNPNILKCNFSGTFNNPEMEDILKVVAMTKKISYLKEDNEYILSGEGCK
ncbi:MAG TPA: FecR domain-containing protein [Cytophagaceae bacterium]|jgi:hypothetical protein